MSACSADLRKKEVVAVVQFDETELAVARANFPTVFVDREMPECYVGSRTATAGDRVRIYLTGWDYEEPEVFRTNEELLAWMKMARKELLV